MSSSKLEPVGSALSDLPTLTVTVMCCVLLAAGISVAACTLAHVFSLAVGAHSLHVEAGVMDERKSNRRGAAASAEASWRLRGPLAAESPLTAGRPAAFVRFSH